MICPLPYHIKGRPGKTGRLDTLIIHDVDGRVADSQLSSDLHFITVHIVGGVTALRCGDFCLISEAVIHFGFLTVFCVFIYDEIFFI